MDIDTLRDIRKKTLSHLYSKKGVADNKTYKAFENQFKSIPEFKLKSNVNLNNVKDQRILNSEFKSLTKLLEKLNQLTGKVNTLGKVNEIVKIIIIKFYNKSFCCEHCYIIIFTFHRFLQKSFNNFFLIQRFDLFLFLKQINSFILRLILIFHRSNLVPVDCIVISVSKIISSIIKHFVKITSFAGNSILNSVYKIFTNSVT
jgi:hypothetical protein